MTYTEQEKKMYELWDYMVETEIATSEEIGIACHFGGRDLHTVEELLFYKTGYRNLEQLFEAEEE